MSARKFILLLSFVGYFVSAKEVDSSESILSSFLKPDHGKHVADDFIIT